MTGFTSGPTFAGPAGLNVRQLDLNNYRSRCTTINFWSVADPDPCGMAKDVHGEYSAADAVGGTSVQRNPTRMARQSGRERRGIKDEKRQP